MFQHARSSVLPAPKSCLGLSVRRALLTTCVCSLIEFVKSKIFCSLKCSDYFCVDPFMMLFHSRILRTCAFRRVASC